MANGLGEHLRPSNITRGGTKIGGKSASRRQTTELNGVLLSETFLLRAMDIDVGATKKILSLTSEY